MYKNIKNRRSVKKYTQRGMAHPELKYIEIDIHSEFSSVSTSGHQIELLSEIVQGTNFYQRIGNKVHVSHIVLTYHMVGGQSNIGTDDAFNVVAVRLIETPGSTTPTIPPVCGVVTVQSTKSLRVLHTEEYRLLSRCPDDTGYMPATKYQHCVIPINSDYVWNQDEGDIYPMKRIYLQIVTDSAIASNPGISVGKVTTFFTDP